MQRKNSVVEIADTIYEPTPDPKAHKSAMPEMAIYHMQRHCSRHSAYSLVANKSNSPLDHGPIEQTRPLVNSSRPTTFIEQMPEGLPPPRQLRASRADDILSLSLTPARSPSTADQLVSVGWHHAYHIVSARTIFFQVRRDFTTLTSSPMLASPSSMQSSQPSRRIVHACRERDSEFSSASFIGCDRVTI